MQKAIQTCPLRFSKFAQTGTIIVTFFCHFPDPVSHRIPLPAQRPARRAATQPHEAWSPPPPPPPPRSAKEGPLGRIFAAPWSPHAQGGNSASIATHPGGSHAAMASPAPLAPSSQRHSHNWPPERRQHFGKGAAARSERPHHSIGGLASKFRGRRGGGRGCDGQPWTPP